MMENVVRKAFFLSVFLISFLLVIGLLKTMYKTYRSGQRVLLLEEEVLELKDEEQRLGEILTERQSEEFVESEARDKLNLVKPDETLVIIDRPEETINDQAELGLKMRMLSNRERWWFLFFGQMRDSVQEK